MLASAQREAVLEAMLAELAAKGYEAISVEDVSRAAGISRGEFEASFAEKDECLFAAYEMLSERMVGTATEGCGAAEPWPERVRRGLSALLCAIAAEPEMALVATRGFPGIRPAAYERYVELLNRFAPLVREGREYSEPADQLPDEVEMLAVGAAEALIFGELDAGRAGRLPRMVPEILFSVLVPFIGPERAGEEMRSAADQL